MKRIAARVLLPLAVAGALSGLAGGVASADPLPGLPTGGPGVWLIPGLDLGGLLGPTVPVPTDVLAPIYGIITPIS
ncbi:hypothetical protein [Amycolatopsis keratiniphila]|uniref:Secreted protein n=1 Tax=Amycolatopsis keratiniphila subsp. keratiniphila TaxID=227715 RepID=A0A1W2LQ50_9PSEU|nr:hypothetical protein [Amycolatopsis keratiniphila]ONF66101.1 hypothetical protein AVR91_0224495 [Amycolatopsis keratiniphila subsp. keratiniphila]